MLDDLEREIESYIETSKPTVAEKVGQIGDSDLLVIKYLSAARLTATLSSQTMYASEEPGYTWGDALYLAPLTIPLSAMMYGDVAVIGKMNFARMRVFDATSPRGIAYYQRWISYHDWLFMMLTTTVHANWANTKLRNNFRTKFQIDCVCFRPDEECPSYTSKEDAWLALTHWSAAREVAYGSTQVVRDLEWCAISTEAFKREHLGYIALLYPAQTRNREFVFQDRTHLAHSLRAAYQTRNRVVVVGF
jgi:hypothetical protein